MECQSYAISSSKGVHRCHNEAKYRYPDHGTHYNSCPVHTPRKYRKKQYMIGKPRLTR